jgi:hypothetical protein
MLHDFAPGTPHIHQISSRQRGSAKPGRFFALVLLMLLSAGFSPASAPVGYVSRGLTTATSVSGFVPGLFEGLPPSSAPPSGLAERVNPAHLLQEAPTYPTGKNPVSVAMGDFNGDGNEDVVTANSYGDNVSILLGNGDGTFRPPVDYAVQVFPTSVTVGDFNGDGKLDLAVSNDCGGDKNCEGRGTVSILLGNGDGTFQPRMDYGVGGYHPSSVAVGDFNGDHKLDLAIANFCGEDSTCEQGPDNVSILLGNGDGTFQSPMKSIVGTSPDSVAVADFNGDGKLDLAVANNGDNTVSILLGKGDGTFRRQVDYTTGPGVSSVAVGDFNGDGKVDLAVADSAGGDAQNSGVSVLLGNGDGTFQQYVDYATGDDPLSVAVADLNDDGKQDLVLANYFGNTVSVLLGNGDGTFNPHSDYGTQFGPTAVLVGSFHGPSRADVVATNSNDTVSVLLGNGTGTFPTHQDFAIAIEPWSLATGDFNGDGKPDVVATAIFGNVVSVLLGNGNGTFQQHVDYDTGRYPYAVVVGDFNHDGKADLATANEQGASVSILLGNGDGTFQPHRDYGTGAYPVSIAAGDFNGDGNLDLVTANYGPNLEGGTITVLLGDIVGAFQWVSSYATGIFPDSVTVGDFNGDHKLDIAVANYCGSDPTCKTAGTVSIFLGNGDGTFQPQVSYNAELKPASVVTADLNNDGKLDLAVVNLQSNTVSILLGNGDGTFQPQVSYLTAGAPYSVAVGDFNGDGKPDVATADDSTASLLIGNGDGTFQRYVDFPVGFSQQSQSQSIAVADFNGDGKTDLATGNSVSSTVSVLLNTTGTTIVLTSSPNPSTKGEPVTFTAAVTGALEGEPTPKGTVTFDIGSGRQEAKLIHGVANFTTSMLPVGKTRVTAHYSGDGTFNPNASGPLIQVVTR